MTDDRSAEQPDAETERQRLQNEVDRLRRCLRAIADNTGGWSNLSGVQQFARQALGQDFGT